MTLQSFLFNLVLFHLKLLIDKVLPFGVETRGFSYIYPIYKDQLLLFLLLQIVDVKLKLNNLQIHLAAWNALKAR